MSVKEFDLVKATENFICRDRFRGFSGKHLWPSEASVQTIDEFGNTTIHGACMRATYFRYTGEQPEKHSVYSQGIFELGKAVEQMLIHNWKQMGIYIADGVRFYNEQYNLSGELDAVIQDPYTRKLIGVECKTINGYQAEVHVLGNKSRKGKPKIEHLLQTLIYTWEFRKRLDHFVLFYEDRGKGTKRGFKVDIVPAELDDTTIVHYPCIDGAVQEEFTIEDIYQRYAEVQEIINKGVCPPREFEMYYSNERVEDEFQKGNISKSKYEKFKRVSKKDGAVRYVEKERPGDWKCRYCNFKSLCYK